MTPRSQKVAIVAASAPPYSSGGVASAHYNLFRALQRAGFEARFFTFGDYVHKDEKGIVRRGTPGWMVSFLRQLNKLVFGLLAPRKQAYQTLDILNSQWGARGMSKAIFAFLPDVIILSDHGAPGLMLKKPPGARIILVSHHNPARFVNHRGFADFSGLDALWAIRLEQFVLNKVDAVVCPSAYMKKWFKKTYQFSGPVSVIPNLLDLQTLKSVHPDNLRSRMGLKKREAIIYMPSAGSRLKGGEYLIAILARLANKNRKIAFYVPGTVSAELKTQVESLSSRPRVFFAGQVPYKKNIAWMKSCSFGISPSLMENYSMAILEAVYCGVPILAFDTGGNSEIVCSGQNGYLVAEGDVNTLVARARRLLNPMELSTLRRKTRKYTETQHTQKKTLTTYIDLLGRE